MKKDSYSINFIRCFFCFFILFLFWLDSKAFAASSTYFDTVQKIYIGYYQRPADPGGLLYWADRLDSRGGNLSEIIEAFANSAESQALYGPINIGNIADVITEIYLAFFNRPAESGGLNYYINGFNVGNFTPATIMLNILYGAQGTDLTSIDNKLTAANLFTRTIDPDLDGSNFQVTYSGEGDVIAARNFLALVTSSQTAIPTQDQIRSYISTNIADSEDQILGLLYPPLTPTGFTVTPAASSTQINLSWSTSTGAVTGYKIYRDGTYLSSTTTTNNPDTGLSHNTNYCYYVTAYNSAGESGPTSELCATTIADHVSVTKKWLTLIVVSQAVEGKYEDNNWERSIAFKENDDIQSFYITIWNRFNLTTNPQRVSLYKFDRTFDPLKDEYLWGGPAWVSYRESFNILSVDVPEPSSKAYLDALKLIMETIVRNQPAEHYGIKYLGHGGGEAALFGSTIDFFDSEILLSYINLIIGKKIDFLDWNTNCGMATYRVAKGQYRYTDYILASDLLRGSYTLYWYISQDALRFEHTKILETFFSPGKTIRQSLVDMINSERMFWEKALMNDMIATKNKESISIFDTSKFEDLVSSTNLEQAISPDDVLTYIRENYPEQEQKFYDFRFHYVNNKDFFLWDVDYNGFRKVD